MGEETGAGEKRGDSGFPAALAEGVGRGHDEVDLGNDARGLFEPKHELQGDEAAGEGTGGGALRVGKLEQVEQFFASVELLENAALVIGGEGGASAAGQL